VANGQVILLLGAHRKKFACITSVALVLQCGARTPVGVKYLADAGPIPLDAEVLDATAEDASDPPDATPDAAVVIRPMVTAVNTHTCAVLVDGRMKCWGTNAHGELGDGTKTAALVPVSVAGLGGLAMFASVGRDNTYAVLTSGDLRCWGANDGGQLGIGLPSTGPSTAPVTAKTGVPIASVASLGEVCALSTQGAVVCWGRDNFAPTTVKGLESGFVQAAVGGGFACALSAAEGVWCWGDNSVGELGDGSWGDRQAPGPVAEITDAIAIAAGASHACAVRKTGAVRCWGSQYFGELGNGTISEDAASLPTTVIGIDDAIAVSAGTYDTCVVTKMGAVKCWGRNTSGELGDGTTLARATPVDVIGLNSGVVGVSIAGGHACAQLATGGVKCWGSGILGDGSNAKLSLPVDVVGIP
jgi:alpha-tubulin suppressor-like RCC1 family protein